MDYPPAELPGAAVRHAVVPAAARTTTFYSNPKFDDLVAQGNQAATNEEAIKLYQEAEDLLLEDMPIMPM